MTKQDIIQKIEKKSSEWLDLNFVTETVAVGTCLCKKNHKMLYSKKTNTFSCFHCDFQNLSLFELTQLAMDKKTSEEDVMIRIIKKYFNSNEEMIKVVCEENKKINDEHDLYVQINEETLSYFQEMLKSNKEALDYIKSRGFSDKDIENYRIGYAPKYNMVYKKFKDKYPVEILEKIGLIGYSEKTEHYYDVFRDRIIFPIYDKNKFLVGFSGRIYNSDGANKYLNTKGTPLFIKNELLYNLHKLTNKTYEKIYVCEGFMDVISMEKANISNVVCTMGTAFSKKHLAELKKHTSQIVMLYDGDAPGIKAANKAMNKLQSDISLLILPENLDPDEYLKKYGNKSFEEYAKANTKSWTDWKIEQLKTKES